MFVFFKYCCNDIKDRRSLEVPKTIDVLLCLLVIVEGLSIKYNEQIDYNQ